MTPTAVGIDLGTTYSAVAYVDDAGTPTVIPNADGQTTTPSVVFVDGDRRAVGAVALNRWVADEPHVVRWIKRAMGDPNYRFQGLSPVEISAEILKSLRADAEAHLGAALGEVVVTCPAYFAAVEVENTRRAGELAGLNVREVVKEPTAAAVFYGVEHMTDGETVLVCDLGGGTYDATVLAYRNGVFMPLASAGDRKLGGHDWTMELVNLVADRAAVTGDDPRYDPVASQLVYEACERAKRDFARVAASTVQFQAGGRLQSVPVTRDEFEARTEYMAQQVADWSEEALARVNPPITWAGVNRVLLVGGSSRLRRVALALAERSGKTPIAVREPDLAVAYGAAILARGQVRRRKGGLADAPAGGLVEVVTTRILPRAVGTRALTRSGGTARITNALVIPHGTELPVEKSRDDFTLASDGQPFVEVPVVEFDPGDDDGFELVGNYKFTTTGGRRGDKVRVTFKYDASGIPVVEATNLRTGAVLPAERRMDYADPDLTRLTTRPRWVVFAVDTSGSMTGEKIDTARRAVVENGRRVLAAHEGNRVAVVGFGSLAFVACDPTADAALLDAAAGALTPSGTTAMDLGILQAVAIVRGAPAGTDRDVVLLTDGMPDDGHREPTVVAAAAVRSEGVTLSTLGVGSKDVDLAFLKALTPHALVVDRASDVSGAMGSILELSAAGRPGLTE